MLGRFMSVSVDCCCKTGSFRWGHQPKLVIFYGFLCHGEDKIGYYLRRHIDFLFKNHPTRWIAAYFI